MTAIAKTPKATPTELLNLAARCETMAEAFTRYGHAACTINSAAANLRSAVGHAMKEIADEEAAQLQISKEIAADADEDSAESPLADR